MLFVFVVGVEGPTCDTNYTLNPISSTCIRLMGDGYTWEEAQSNCKAMGDNLAVFTTKSAVDWIREFVRSQPVDSGNYNISDIIKMQILISRYIRTVSRPIDCRSFLLSSSWQLFS